MTTTIQSIGRVACSIPEVTEVCLHGLTMLLSNKDGKYILHGVLTVVLKNSYLLIIKNLIEHSCYLYVVR